MMLKIEGVSHAYGSKTVLHDVNLEILRGQFTAMVGPSGCGKSTLFKAILGSLKTDSGAVMVNGSEVIGPNRNVGVVYQKYALQPFLTVEENVAVGPMWDQTTLAARIFRRKWWKELRSSHVEEARKLLRKLRLGDCMESYPAELSGGQQQRVAIAQALIMKPAVLLLDEPFGALDENTREELQKLLLTLYQENLIAIQAGLPAPYTVVIITHELDEAFYVSDRVIALSRFWTRKNGDDITSGMSAGATVVFDQPSPVYHPNDPRDFVHFHELKMMVKKVAFDPNNHTHDPNEFVRETPQEVGTGVLL